MRRAHGDRGASVVELALVLPLLALLAFAVAEVGLAWTAENRVQSSISTAARTGASAGRIETADVIILSSLQAALPAQDLAGLDRVVIFRADSANGAMPAGCLRPFGSDLNTPANGSLGCNSYSGDLVRSLTDANASSSGFSSSSTRCTSSRIDRYFCPWTRKDTLSGPPDWLGIYVRIVHPNPIPFFFDDFTFEKTAVYRIQPDYTG